MDTGKVYNFGEKPGPWSTKLYNTLRGIQYGTVEDKHGWTTVVIEQNSLKDIEVNRNIRKIKICTKAYDCIQQQLWCNAFY